MFAFLRLLFGSIDGAEEHAHTRKTEKSAFREIFVARYIPILQYCIPSNKHKCAYSKFEKEGVLAIFCLATHNVRC